MIMQARQVCSLHSAKTSSSVVAKLLCFVCSGELGGEIILLVPVWVIPAGSAPWESWLLRTSTSFWGKK